MVLVWGRFWLFECLLAPPAYLEGLKFRFGHTGTTKAWGNPGRQLASLFWATEIGNGLGVGLLPAISRVFVSRASCLGTRAARYRSGSSGSLERLLNRSLVGF